jgi:hypothetical protein
MLIGGLPPELLAVVRLLLGFHDRVCIHGRERGRTPYSRTPPEP